MNKKIKKDEIIKIATHNIEEARDHLNLVKGFAEKDLGGTPKTMRSFKKLLSEDLDERIKALDSAIAGLNGGKQEIRIDGDLLGNAKWRLKDIGNFIGYVKEATNSDSTFDSPTVLFDAIYNVSKERAEMWNDIVEELDEVFFNLPLDRIRID